MKTDGTTAETVLLIPGNDMMDMAHVNGKLFMIMSLNGNSLLYKSDGTAAGTVTVENKSNSEVYGTLGVLGSEVFLRCAYNGYNAFFRASDTLPLTAVKEKFAASEFTFHTVGNTLYFTVDKPCIFKDARLCCFGYLHSDFYRH